MINYFTSFKFSNRSQLFRSQLFVKPLHIRIIVCGLCAGLIALLLFSENWPSWPSMTSKNFVFLFVSLTYFIIRFWLKPAFRRVSPSDRLTGYAMLLLLVIICLFNSAVIGETWLKVAKWVTLVCLFFLSIKRDIKQRFRRVVCSSLLGWAFCFLTGRSSSM